MWGFCFLEPLYLVVCCDPYLVWEADAMKCPYCGNARTRVIDTTHSATGIRRRRVCRACDQRFSTMERAILTTPLVVKRDGHREEFDRAKLLSGLRTACARRPRQAAGRRPATWSDWLTGSSIAFVRWGRRRSRVVQSVI